MQVSQYESGLRSNSVRAREPDSKTLSLTRRLFFILKLNAGDMLVLPFVLSEEYINILRLRNWT